VAAVSEQDRLLMLLATLRHQRRVLVQALLDHPEHRRCCGL